MTLCLREIRDRTRSQFEEVMRSLGQPVAERDRQPFPIRYPHLMTPHQRWVFHERVDLQAALNLSRERDQARFIKWWINEVPKEYLSGDEAVGWGHLSAPFDPTLGAFSTLITNLMQTTYWLRKGLSEEFDLGTRIGRVLFIDWFFRRGLFEEQLDDTPYVHHILAELTAEASSAESDLPINKFAAFVLRRYRDEFRRFSVDGVQSVADVFPSVLNRCAPELLYLYNLLTDGIRPVNRKLSLRFANLRSGNDAEQVGRSAKGVNMIGYAHGTFGMGEHVRMSARALSTWTDALSIIDVNSYAHARQPESDILEWCSRAERFATNIFHVNADVMAGALTTVGPSLGVGRYNIGYWAWELSKVPDAWRPSIDYVDEIWAPSRSIQEAFQQETDKPVVYMPLCVDLAFDKWHRRKHFGLPEDKFLFLYYFDSYSYFERKNPFAALRAFKRAFPDREDVGLVIKTQNASVHSSEWRQLVALTDGDERIHILNQVMSKSELMSLQAECDCFVSLHRSEGFGRGPAEALWLGKPVICTAYSGNMDFTTSDNSLLVDYELVPVKAHEYPFHRGQVWAHPDEEQAAVQMQRLLNEPQLARRLGQNGAALMRDKFGMAAVGKLYADRLKQLGAL